MGPGFHTCPQLFALDYVLENTFIYFAESVCFFKYGNVRLKIV